MSNWPQNGDSIFAIGSDWETNALIDAPWDWFIRYAATYKTAADLIIGNVEVRHVSPDEVSYPVLFLYRHYLEIMLKGLINVGNMLENRTAGFPTGHHKLKDLWHKCRPLLEAAVPEGDKNDTDAVEKCLIELHQIDPTGESFRFGEDTKGNSTIPASVQINLVNLRDVMNRLAGFLEGSYDYMYELLGYQADIDSDSDW